MILQPMDVLAQFPIRKNRQQKQTFRTAIQQYALWQGYEYHEEKASFNGVNVILGNPEKAKFLISAHYDTCAAMPFPNLITPCNFWSFMGYQFFITIVLVLPALVLGAMVGYFTGMYRLVSTVTMLTLYLTLALLLFGPANKNNANDNTSGVVTLLEMAQNLPRELREQVCFVLFDLEEAGLLGSSSYRSKHKKAIKNQLIINLDCVGEGDNIVLFPSRKVLKNQQALHNFHRICGNYGIKNVSVRDRGFSVYPSDQANFPYGIGICALRKSKFGLYLSRIHTKNDTILDQTNVQLVSNLLIDTIINYHS